MTAWWSKLPDAGGKAGVLSAASASPGRSRPRVFWDGTAENQGAAPATARRTANGRAPTARRHRRRRDRHRRRHGRRRRQPRPQALASPIRAAGPRPGVSALGYSSGKLNKAKQKAEPPFTVSARPSKGTPAVKITVTANTSLTASLAKVGAKHKLTPLKGKKVFQVTSLEAYLKLTGSWNNKTLPKGTYRLTLRSFRRRLPGRVHRQVARAQASGPFILRAPSGRADAAAYRRSRDL